jgi:hypothetical protein
MAKTKKKRAASVTGKCTKFSRWFHSHGQAHIRHVTQEPSNSAIIKKPSPFSVVVAEASAAASPVKCSSPTGPAAAARARHRPGPYPSSPPLLPHLARKRIIVSCRQLAVQVRICVVWRAPICVHSAFPAVPSSWHGPIILERNLDPGELSLGSPSLRG